jgi:hypothetical protein
MWYHLESPETAEDEETAVGAAVTVETTNLAVEFRRCEGEKNVASRRRHSRSPVMIL